MDKLDQSSGGEFSRPLVETWNWAALGMRRAERQYFGVRQYVEAEALEAKIEALHRIARAKTLEEAVIRARVALGELGTGALLAIPAVEEKTKDKGSEDGQE